MFKSILLIILFLLPVSGFASLKEVIDLYKKSVFACPEKIWPNADFSKDKTLIFSVKSKQAYLLFNNTASVVSFENEMNEIATYDFREYKGEVIAWANTDFSFGEKKLLALDLFNIAFHESFHFYHQSEMDDNYSTEGRSGTYPMDAMARVHRQHLQQALIRHLRGDVKALGEAKFWHRLHRQSGERIETDIIEGSAQYAAYKAGALATLGCEANDNEIKIEILLRIENDSPSESDKELEHYNIGSLAFLAMDKNLSKVLKELTGVQLLDYLLKDVTELPATYDSELSTHVRDAVAALNQDFENLYVDMKSLEVATTEKQSFVAIPYSHFLAAYRTGGSFQLSSGADLDIELEVLTSFGEVSGNSYSQSNVVNNLCNQSENYSEYYYSFKIEKMINDVDGANLRVIGANFELVIPKDKITTQLLNAAQISCISP